VCLRAIKEAGDIVEGKQVAIRCGYEQVTIVSRHERSAATFGSTNDRNMPAKADLAEPCSPATTNSG
jgi:hypothetical protein